MDRSTVIVWLRHDLRLEDNTALQTALHSASSRGGAVVPAFVWAPEEEGEWAPGAASRWWLHRSLAGLSTALEQAGSNLVIRKGSSLEVLTALARETDAGAVHFNRRFEPLAAARDRRAMVALTEAGVEVRAFNDSLLFDPDEIRNRAGEPFKVFTPFWKHLLTLEDPGTRIPRPKRIAAPPAGLPRSLAVDDLGLEPAKDWASGLRESWTPGEAGAHAQLRHFLAGAHGVYATGRDRPDVAGTSRLSPHLHFGELSPRRVWYEVARAGLRHGATRGHEAARSPARSRHGATHTRGDHPGAESDPFLRQLVWREFSYHLLHHFPHTATRPLREAFERFPWREDTEGLCAWTQGKTGYPIVDAGMRELWATGWMHNRVRLIVASFLVKDLMVHWIEGARWFWDTLVDADLANNTMGWQWTAGSGADAAPYFRIFNPVGQGRKFDPDGAYVRRWVPELAALPAEHIHEPWRAPAAVLRAASIEIGKTYPAPVVDHAQARDRALAAFRKIGK